MYTRILQLPLEHKQSMFLFGPRGTGKTSWIKKHLTDALYLDLLDFSLYSKLSSNPARLNNLIGKNNTKLVVIDEVQRVPELLNEVHRLIESRNIQFLLTGSSARNLRKQGVNLLAGRALTYHMHPLTMQEIGDDFDMQKVLQYGLLPTTLSHPNPKKYLQSYVQTYIREEVLQEGLTRNIGSFNKFLEAASFSQGGTINISEIARELSLNRHVVSNYFSILEDLLLAIKVNPFTHRAKRKTIAHQKFYLFDVGVYKTLRPAGPLDTQAELDGAGLETLFLQSVRAINDYYNLEHTIYFWRTATGTEVDFILYGPNGLYAFEIKHATTVTNKSLKGLRSFLKDYPEAQAFLLYQGTQKEYYDDIKVLPFEYALQNLPTILKK